MYGSIHPFTAAARAYGHKESARPYRPEKPRPKRIRSAARPADAGRFGCTEKARCYMSPRRLAWCLDHRRERSSQVDLDRLLGYGLVVLSYVGVSAFLMLDGTSWSSGQMPVRTKGLFSAEIIILCLGLLGIGCVQGCRPGSRWKAGLAFALPWPLFLLVCYLAGG